jgi:predicted RNA-binding Zn-ribbon protein involved in translation (DUF1610 family)
MSISTTVAKCPLCLLNLESLSQATVVKCPLCLLNLKSLLKKTTCGKLKIDTDTSRTKFLCILWGAM